MSKPLLDTMTSPVLVTGPHRSCSTLVIQLLERIGLHTGTDAGHNREAWFFQRRNEWMMKQAGGSWFEPEPLRAALADETRRADCVDRMKCSIQDASFRKSFWGSQSPDHQWGWKDPRLLFTYPVWTSIFPESRLIVVQRNGLDAAESLHRRTLSRDKLSPPGPLRVLRSWIMEQRQPVVVQIPKSKACQSWTGCFKLWAAYMEQATLLQKVDALKVKTIDAETLLTEPAKALTGLADFCGLDVDDGLIHKAVHDVDASRADAFRRSEALLARTRDPDIMCVLEQYGYGKDLSA